ncbi:putative TIM-barrel fold metal-dependent hydrolase [Amycolatopsis lexingtonensis]|uniref:TIM-barrel fold metal-dependent hydrolase n=1 Tax=Amycolatopsis lexingtonensis TaxID=218822 RepID=A0ABR9HYC0_9PSEU|nr:amidohydrolase family protein [Amycolatopsis lexingtonensis]MBE1495927.1 putative TIM-barrel fold metal-dependent hydrolase [Amycolatopsis lexingtonensis]
MTLICIEEHAIDPPIAEAARPVLDREAPYLRMQSSSSSPVRPGPGRHPAVDIHEAIRLGTDLGPDRVRRMDEHGIDTQIVSWTSPIQLVPDDQALALCRSANDRLAKAVAEHPDRLQGLAALPWQQPAAAADELDRAVGLGLRGVLILGRPGAGFLDDPAYLPVLDRIAARGVPLYVHPFHPVPQVQQAYYAGFSEKVTAELSLSAWGWHHEAGIHVLRLILAGVFERLPGLQVISGHWGEMVPFYLSRLDDVLSPGDTGLSRTITEVYRSNVWVTPSGMFHRPQFDFVRAVVGLDRVIWSTDYPFLHLDGTREFLAGLDLTAEERENITHRNAERLFRLNGA